MFNIDSSADELILRIKKECQKRLFTKPADLLMSIPASYYQNFALSLTKLQHTRQAEIAPKIKNLSRELVGLPDSSKEGFHSKYILQGLAGEKSIAWFMVVMACQLMDKKIPTEDARLAISEVFYCITNRELSVDVWIYLIEAMSCILNDLEAIDGINREAQIVALGSTQSPDIEVAIRSAIRQTNGGTEGQIRRLITASAITGITKPLETILSSVTLKKIPLFTIIDRSVLNLVIEAEETLDSIEDLKNYENKDVWVKFLESVVFVATSPDLIYEQQDLIVQYAFYRAVKCLISLWTCSSLNSNLKLLLSHLLKHRDKTFRFASGNLGELILLVLFCRENNIGQIESEVADVAAELFMHLCTDCDRKDIPDSKDLVRGVDYYNLKHKKLVSQYASYEILNSDLGETTKTDEELKQKLRRSRNPATLFMCFRILKCRPGLRMLDVSLPVYFKYALFNCGSELENLPQVPKHTEPNTPSIVADVECNWLNFDKKAILALVAMTADSNSNSENKMDVERDNTNRAVQNCVETAAKRFEEIYTEKKWPTTIQLVLPNKKLNM